MRLLLTAAFAIGWLDIKFSAICKNQQLFLLDLCHLAHVLYFQLLIFQLSICIRMTNRYCQPIANASPLAAKLKDNIVNNDAK